MIESEIEMNETSSFVREDDRSAELAVYARHDFEIKSAAGARLECADGRELIDFYGGHAVALLGYRHPRILETLGTAAERVFFQSNAVDLASRRRAARRLADFAPDGLEQVFFVNSGAEAVENALRLAFHSTSRQKVVALEGGFHGRCAAAGAVTWKATQKWYRFPRTPFDTVFVPPNDEEALEAAIDDDTAALILEPVQGIAGAFPLSPRFLESARRITTAKGAVLIADEVQSGMGRCGHAFAIEAADVVPDILTTAKGLATGFPASAVITTDEVAEGVAIGDLGSTFGGGPLACALIETVIDVIEAEELIAKARQTASSIFRELLVGPVTQIQGAGLLIGLVTGPPAKEVLAHLLEHGILAGSSANPHVLRLMPPLIIGPDEVGALKRALLEFSSS